MNRTAAVELSLNFFITILLSLVVLTASITILYRFISESERTQQDLDERTKEQLSALLDQGNQIVIPFSRQTISKGEEHVFGIGILNIFDQKEFKLTIELSSAESKEGVDISREIDIKQWASYIDTPFTLDKNQRHTVRVLIGVPDEAKSGTYIFNAKVTEGPASAAPKLYDTIKKIVITVP